MVKNTEIEELATSVSDLYVTLEETNQKLKSDYTGWNIVEAIENLSFELKRLNDREENKK